MTDLVSIPVALIESLAAAISKHPGPHTGEAAHIITPAMDLVLYARAQDAICVCGHPERWHGVSGHLNCTGMFGRCECNTFIHRDG